MAPNGRATGQSIALHISQGRQDSAGTPFLILIKVWRHVPGDSACVAPLGELSLGGGRSAVGIAVPEGNVNGAESYRPIRDEPAFMRR